MTKALRLLRDMEGIDRWIEAMGGTVISTAVTLLDDHGNEIEHAEVRHPQERVEQ